MAELGTFFNAGGKAWNSPASGLEAMSSAVGTYVQAAGPYDGADRSSFNGPDKSLPTPVTVLTTLTVYEMRGRDQDCASLTYRYWRSYGSPDLLGSSYAGPKCGVQVLADIVVLESFNLT